MALLLVGTLAVILLVGGTVFLRRSASEEEATKPALTTSPAEEITVGPPDEPTGTFTSESAVGPAQSSNIAETAEVFADSTAPDGVNSAGQPVSYGSGNLVDGDLTTTWRAPGDASSQSLTFSFPAPVTITAVGLTNGYTKVDPASGANRYAEERRILSVSWVFDDGSRYDENLADGVFDIQSITFQPVTTESVRLIINSTTPPGALDRDYTAISEVQLQRQ